MRALLVALVLVCAAFTVQAQVEPDGCLTHSVPVTAVNSAGTVRFCIRSPREVPSQDDSFRVSATVSTPALTGQNPSVSIVATSVSGCTLGAVETHQTSAGSSHGATVSKSWVVAQDGRQCTLNLRATVTSGGSTVSALDQAINVRTQTDWWDTFGLFVYVLWIACFVLSRFIRGLFSGTLRVLLDVVSAAGILALPIPAAQFQLLAAASYLVIMVDLVAVLLRPGVA